MQNQCIYYKERNNLNFDTAEHVFPAALGGIMTLPKGYVSLEFNNDISAIELKFIRDSPIALPRQILGPGKKGKLGISHATKSHVHLIENVSQPGSFTLGYIQLGKPFEIPQIRVNKLTGELSCSIPNYQDNENAKLKLIGHLREYEDKNVRYTEDKRLSENDFIIGFDRHIHLYKNPNNPFKLDQVFVENLEAAIFKFTSAAVHQKFNIQTNQNVTLGNEFYRVYAKTAFNALAMLKGKDFVLSDEFDEIRNYIAYGSDKHLVDLKPAINKVINFPEDSHRVILSSGNGNLIANVSFYYHFEAQVMLSSNFTGKISAEGYICDWKEKREIPLTEYIAGIINQTTS